MIEHTLKNALKPAHVVPASNTHTHTLRTLCTEAPVSLSSLGDASLLPALSSARFSCEGPAEASRSRLLLSYWAVRGPQPGGVGGLAASDSFAAAERSLTRRLLSGDSRSSVYHRYSHKDAGKH